MNAISQKNNKAFIISLISATFLMGTGFIASKALISRGIPPVLLAGFRFLAASFFIFPVLAFDKNGFLNALFPRNLSKKQYLIIFLIGIFQTACAMGLISYSMKHISAANGAILLFTNPLWVALLGWIFLKEKISRLRAIGLIIGFIGVVCAVGGGVTSESGIVPQLIGTCAAISWAVSTTINKKFNLPINIWSLSFWQTFIGALIILICSQIMGDKLPNDLGIKDVLWFIWLSGPASALSFSMWFVALQKGGATTASSFLFLAPMFSVIQSFVLFGSKIAIIQGIGGILIGTAIYMINHTPPKNESEKDKLLEAQMMGEP